MKSSAASAARRSSSSVVCQSHINTAIEAANAQGNDSDRRKIRRDHQGHGRGGTRDRRGGRRGGHRPGEGVRRIAGHPPRELPDFRRDQAGGLRHPHRAPRKTPGDPLPHRRRALRGDEPPVPHARGRASAASRSWPTWTSPNAACRRTAASAPWSTAATSTCASPPCPRNTAKKRSSASSTTAPSCWAWSNWASPRTC